MRARFNSRWASICVLFTLGTTLATACGSDDGKKKSMSGPKYNAGGDDNDSGGSSAQGDAGDGTGNSVGGMTGDAGMTATGGAGGDNAHLFCIIGLATCPGDVGQCETPTNTLTQCGGCDISCSDSNGTVECQERDGEEAQCVMTSCDAGYGDCDEDGTTGCEEALAENDAHCGDCARDCAAAGSTCDTSWCKAVTVLENARTYAPTMIGDTFFYMQVNAKPVGAYTLYQVALGTGSKKEVWAASGNVGLGALWTDATDVYWAVSGTPPSVLKKAHNAATDDLPVVVFQPDSQPNYFVGQGASFYWASDNPYGTGFIYGRSKTAKSNVKGAAIMSVDQGQFSAFVTTPTTIYWIGSKNGPELRMVPNVGGSPVPVPDAVVSSSSTLWVNGETLYFVRNVGQNALNGIYSYTAGDQTVKQLVAHDYINALIVDDNFIYYKLQDATYNAYRAKVTGGAGVRIADGVYGFYPFVGQDDTYIYQGNDWGSDGPLQKIVK